jgi:hypothetical protein
MLLAKIQTAMGNYKTWLKETPYHPQLYKWESLQVFQANWKIDAADPALMFDQCFHNSENRRLWQVDNWQPKRVMTEFWKTDPMTVRLMFDDLFNETRGVEGRIGRFVFGCDELLRDYRRAHIGSIENSHYHDDFRMISIYLAFQYPETYALYDFTIFQKALEYLGARDIPQQNDIARYYKVLKTLQTFLDKDPEIEKALQQHLQVRKHYQGKTMFTVEDFCVFIANNAVQV